MKKLIVSLILAVVLTATFATPAFAWGPGDMPDAAKKGLERTREVGDNAQSYQSMLQGLIAPYYYGNKPNPWGDPYWAYIVIGKLLALANN